MINQNLCIFICGCIRFYMNFLNRITKVFSRTLRSVEIKIQNLINQTLYRFYKNGYSYKKDTDRQTDRQTHTDRQTDTQTDRHTHTHTERHTDRQTDTTDKQTNRQTD